MFSESRHSSGGTPIHVDRPSEKPPAVIEKKIALARSIHESTKQGKDKTIALRLGTTDPEFAEKAKEKFDNSLQKFSTEGEKSVERVRQKEMDVVASTNLDIAIAVEEGVISREAALIIAKRFGRHLNPDQLCALAAAFVARETDEKLDQFNIRRQMAIESLQQIQGLTPEETAYAKQDIRDVLGTYWLLESQHTKRSDWPKRSDGQIRRSFIDRPDILDLALKIVDEVNAASKNIEQRVKTIESQAEIPRKISELKQLISLVDNNKEVRGVTFDMFDTLVQWTSNSAERKKIMMENSTALLQSYGLPISIEEFKRARTEIWDEKYKKTHYPTREFKAADALKEIVEKICNKYGKELTPEKKEKLIAELEDVFIEVDADTALPMPGVIKVLQELKQRKIKVAVISNHPYKHSSVKDLLDRFGLSSYVDELIVSSDVGVCKSQHDENATIFRLALDRLHLKPGQVLHAGDNPDADCIAPRKIGIRGIEYNNPATTQKNIEHQKLDHRTTKYKEESLKAHREYLGNNAQNYYEHNKTESAPAGLEPFALRLYEISREKYGPLIIKFAERCLEKIRGGKTMNLCTGRDAIPMFLVQRRLLQLFPEKYRDIDPKQIQLVNISRNLALKSTKKDLDTYLAANGFDTYEEINVVDNGFEGTIQDRLTKLYPEKQIYGSYLQATLFREDPNKDRKDGYVSQADASRTVNAAGQTERTYFSFTGIDDDLMGVYNSLDYIHNQEDMWNGIFSSPEPLGVVAGKIRPKNWKGGKREKMDFIPGNKDIIPGIDEIENFQLLKKIALKGILDSIKVYRRQTQLGVAPSREDAIRTMGEWFKDNNNADTFDRRLIDGMVRHRK